MAAFFLEGVTDPVGKGSLLRACVFVVALEEEKGVGVDVCAEQA